MRLAARPRLNTHVVESSPDVNGGHRLLMAAGKAAREIDHAAARDRELVTTGIEAPNSPARLELDFSGGPARSVAVRVDAEGGNGAPIEIQLEGPRREILKVQIEPRFAARRIEVRHSPGVRIGRGGNHLGVNLGGALRKHECRGPEDKRCENELSDEAVCAH